MTLYEYIKQHNTIDELIVWDKDYEMEIYFYPDCTNPNNVWDKAMEIIAKKLNVVKRNSKECITINLSEVIERNIHNGIFDELFKCNDTDFIMADIQNIFAGYVSDSWMIEFANSLK